MSARGPIQDVLRTQAKWLTTRPDPRHQSAELAPRGRDWLTMAGWMNEAADLIESLLDPENKLFLRHYAEQMERLEAELAEARNSGQFGLDLLRAVDENFQLRSQIEQFQELVRRLTRQRNAACTVAERYVVDLPAELAKIYHPKAGSAEADAIAANSVTHSDLVPTSALEAGDLCGQGTREEPACTLIAGHDGPHEQWEEDES